MTQISKAVQRLALLSVGITVLASASLTAPASAAVASSPFCTNLTASMAKITSRFTNLQTKAVAAADARDQAITSRSATWDKQLADARATWDAKRTESLQALLDKAKNRQQQAALQQYQQSITAAIQNRRALNDEARTAYRESVSKIMTATRTGVAADSNTLAASINAAKAAAEASCKATPADGPAIRQTLAVALKKARDTYKFNRQDRPATKFLLDAPIAERNKTIKENEGAYLRTATEARNTLRATMRDNSL